MKSFQRPVCLLLIPVLVLCSLPVSARAQTGDPLDPVVSASSSSSNDDTTEALLVGFFVVVVAVVFILGFKSDFGRSKFTKKAELEETYADLVRDGALPTTRFAPPELAPAELDLVQAPGGTETRDR